MKYIIVIPQEIFTETREFFLHDPNNEQFGYLFAGCNVTDQFVKLLVHTFLPARDKDDLEHQSVGGVCPSPKFQMRAYSICKTQGYHLIDIHSHPFDSSGHVQFSGIDNRYEFGHGYEGVFGFTAKWNPGMYHASIVFGQNSLDARIYRPEEGRPVPINEVQIMISKSIIPTSAQLRTPIQTQQQYSTEYVVKSDEELKKKDGGSFVDNFDSIYSRQILAFGKAGQEALANTTVAVIGAGGLGSIIVETLARIGVKELICVDDDVVEFSNISRVLGSTLEDAKKKINKVDVLARHVELINTDLKFIPIADSVLNPEVLKALKYADYIISGTDTYSSRLVLNQFSIQYLIPFLNLGFGMETDVNHTKLISAGGKIIIFVPGNWCYYCLGEIDQRELQIELMSTEDKQRQVLRGYISGVDIPDPSVLFLNMTVASLGVCEFLNLLAPFKERNYYLFYDMLSTKLWHIKANKDPDCPICSSDAEIFGRGDLIMMEDIRDLGQNKTFPDN